MKLRPSRIFLIVGLLLLIFTLTLLILFLLKFNASSFYIFLASLLPFLFFLACSIYLILHYFRYRIEFNDNHLTIHTELGHERIIEWQEVKSVKYNRIIDSIILTCKNDSRVRISPIYSYFLPLIDKDKFHRSMLSKFN